MPAAWTLIARLIAATLSLASGMAIASDGATIKSDGAFPNQG